MKYKDQKAKTIAEFKGYQKLDPAFHPEVIRAAKATELQDQVDNFRSFFQFFLSTGLRPISALN